MYDQHAWPLALLRIVPDEKSFQHRVALFVLDGFGLDRRLRDRHSTEQNNPDNRYGRLELAHEDLLVAYTIANVRDWLNQGQRGGA